MNEPVQSIAFEAAFLQLGFRLGYYSRADIERWTDRQIEQADQPSMDLIELAILRGKHDWDVVVLLSRISSEIGPRVRTELTIGMVGKLFRTGKTSLEQSVRILFSLLHDDDYKSPQEEKTEIYCLDDAYDLAVKGYESLGEVRTRLLAFTDPYVAIVADKELAIVRSAAPPN